MTASGRSSIRSDAVCRCQGCRVASRSTRTNGRPSAERASAARSRVRSCSETTSEAGRRAPISLPSVCAAGPAATIGGGSSSTTSGDPSSLTSPRTRSARRAASTPIAGSGAPFETATVVNRPRRVTAAAASSSRSRRNRPSSRPAGARRERARRARRRRRARCTVHRRRQRAHGPHPLRCRRSPRSPSSRAHR